MILMSTWQTLLGSVCPWHDANSLDIKLTTSPPRTIVFGLGNGGTAGLIYLYIIVVIFFSLVNISMAEMASMAPTAGEPSVEWSRLPLLAMLTR